MTQILTSLLIAGVLFFGSVRCAADNPNVDFHPALTGKVMCGKQAGCSMLYVAMFDEVDEGTAIFKCTNHPPIGSGAKFLNYEDLSTDFYLRLVGKAGEMLRGKIPLTNTIP